MKTLGLESLARLPADVERPRYDPTRVRVGIVHLGLGAFHRAHQAVYTDDVLASDPNWGILGVSMKTPRATAALSAQQGLYTVLAKDATTTSARVVGALRETAFARDDVSALVQRIAHDDVRVVTLTVTEKGYCRSADGGLDLQHPDIVDDLAAPARPRSAIGLLVAAMDKRRRDGGAPINVVSCDNLPSNGRVLERLVRELASHRSADLVAWIDANVAFPATMVDRIVPATTPDDQAEVERRLGMRDAAPVVAEPFSQWVIEERFAAAIPDWRSAGATLVGDVEPFETMKLRMLNGSHSTLAYLGFLAGHPTIAGAASDPTLRAFVERQMLEEVAPSLRPPPDMRPSDYAHTLMQRFANPALPHKTAQVAMDGSQKLPQRWLATIRDNLAAQRSVSHLAVSVAAWMRYVCGRDGSGNATDVVDPLSARFASIAAANRDARGIARELFSIASIFGEDLAKDPRIVEPVTAALSSMLELGAVGTVQRFERIRAHRP